MDRLSESHEWTAFADDDLAAAELLNSQFRKSLPIICFHCQQSAEKYLKAWLIIKAIPFERTHDLVALCRLCQTGANDFSQLEDDCFQLNPFAVITRYPSELELIDDDANFAIQSATRIKNFILSHLKGAL